MVRRGRNKQVEHEQATERFRAVIRKNGLRWTGEREAIVDAVLSSTGHFNVERLVSDLRARGVAASRATVYRAMPLLIEAGLVQPTGLSGEERQYESAIGEAHHDHLVCRRCSKVVEFKYDAFEVLQHAVAEQYGFELIGHVHELIGICAECRAGATAGQAQHATGSQEAE